MFIKNKLEAIIIGHEVCGEADSRIILLTNELGKVRALARGEKKILSKMRGGLGLFSWSEIELVAGRSHLLITSAKPKMMFNHLATNWQKFVVAEKMMSDVNRLTPWEMPDESTWLLSRGGLRALNLIPRHYQRLYYYFLWTLLSGWGYQINLNHCARCQTILGPKECYLVAQEGIVCSACLKDQECQEKVALNTIKILRLIAQKEKKILGRIRAAQADKDNLESVSRFFIDSVARDRVFVSKSFSS